MSITNTLQLFLLITFLVATTTQNQTPAKVVTTPTSVTLSPMDNTTIINDNTKDNTTSTDVPGAQHQPSLVTKLNDLVNYIYNGFDFLAYGQINITLAQRVGQERQKTATSDVKRQLSDVKSQLSDVKSQLSEMKAENKRLRSGQINITLAQRVGQEQQKSDISDVKRQLSDVKSQLSEMKAENKRLTSGQINIMVDQRVGQEQQKSDISDVKHQLREMKAESTRLRSGQINIKSQLNKIKAENTLLKSSVSTMQAQIGLMSKGVEKLLILLTKELTKPTTTTPTTTMPTTTTPTTTMSTTTTPTTTTPPKPTPKDCVGGRSMNGVCYKIDTCSPRCTIATAKQMCTKMGATLAPLRSRTIYNAINNDRKQLSIGTLWIDGSDAATEGTWRYHDKTLSYTNWGSGEPNQGTRANSVYISGDKMYDGTTSYTLDGVTCAWE